MPRYNCMILLCAALLVLTVSVRGEEPDALPEQLKETMKRLATAPPPERKALLETLARDGDARLVPALEAFNSGLLELRDGRLVIYRSRVTVEGRGQVYPLVDAFTLEPILDEKGTPAFASGLGTMVKATRPERKLVAAATAALSLLDPDPIKRREAITVAADRADANLLEPLRTQLQTKPDDELAPVLAESVTRIELAHGDRAEKLAAAKALGQIGTNRAAESLKRALTETDPADAELIAALNESIAAAERYQTRIRVVQHTFSGLSLASILILLALGLAIIFGLMGVINMAHGEFMMIGAFTTYLVASFFQRHWPGAYDWYFVAAIPAAFIVSAIAGYLCELLIIRRLYGRPLETLLATWGLSLVLIQLARVLFGDTLSVSSPSWLQGGWEIAPDLTLPALRLFILGFCLACVLAVFGVIRFTKLGLLLRATTQNREMAAALGVPTRRVDGLTFAFGTGLAGLAGVVVPLYNKINPNVGQEYIVESFMVVVVGGVGNLAGVIVAGLGLGFIAKYLEPLMQGLDYFASSASVLSRISVLMLVVFVLSWRPAGLFPQKGRLADA